jgi:hypothetical protein
VALAGVVLAVVLVVVLATRGDGPSDVDCSTFRVTPDRWARADYDRRVRLQRGLQECGQLAGRLDTEVVAILGPPDRNGAGEIDYHLPYGTGATDRQVWRIRLDAEHRVASMSTTTP